MYVLCLILLTKITFFELYVFQTLLFHNVIFNYIPYFNNFTVSDGLNNVNNDIVSKTIDISDTANEIEVKKYVTHVSLKIVYTIEIIFVLNGYHLKII